MGIIVIILALPMGLPSVYLTSSHDQLSQAFPFHICIPQEIKIGGGNGL